MGTHTSINRTHQDVMLAIGSKLCNQGDVSTTGWCPEIWDKILCWPSTAPGELAVQPCPRYILGFNGQDNASRQCMANGQWYWNPNTNSTWSNYTECYIEGPVTVRMTISDIQANNATLIEKFFPIVKTISKVGYTISLFTLIIAFCILAAIKKLRCPRNILHMHLFASFVMRACMALLMDLLFVSGIGLADMVIKDDENYWLVDKMESNWHCKIFTSLWQYFILANYSWILMEGIYLHNLVFLALFTDSNSSIAGYVVSGWGLPAIFVLPWIATRIIYENTYCWTTNDKPLLFLFIRVPTMLSILINFVLFINIVRMLFLKLRSTVSEETQRYKRWARSTLVLVPLFGIHYTVFLGMSYSIGVNETVEIIWLFCDQLFASFQGCFVAILYCFLNGEVRTELSRVLRSSKCSRFRRDRKRQSTHSISTCSCKSGRHTGNSKRWRGCWKTSCLFPDVGTRGCSLASSREQYLEITGNGQTMLQATQNQHVHHTSPPLCNKCTDRSLLSVCSNISEMSANTGSNVRKIRDQHRWSDSECCHLEYELHNLQQHSRP